MAGLPQSTRARPLQRPSKSKSEEPLLLQGLVSITAIPGDAANRRERRSTPSVPLFLVLEDLGLWSQPGLRVLWSFLR
jgi:hypothetical protein